jgi:diacylglycerol kinase (ATP)
MSGIGVILNPHSKRYKNDPHKLDRMAFIVGERGHFRATQDLDNLSEVAHQFKKKEIDILALSGGDGTNHCVLTSLIDAYGDQPLPKVALLRGGTLNTVATSCGIWGDPEKNLMKVIYDYHADKEMKKVSVYPMCVNGSYGFIWGCGVIYRFMDSYYGGGSPSPLQAAWTLTKSISSSMLNAKFARRLFRRFDGEVIADGKKWPYANYTAIYAGSIEQLGLNFRVFYHADDEHFHGVAFSMPPRNILRYVPKMFLGRSSGCPDLIEEPCKEMIIKLEEAQGYTIDGDMYDPVDHFEITRGPELEIIIP